MSRVATAAKDAYLQADTATAIDAAYTSATGAVTAELTAISTYRTAVTNDTTIETAAATSFASMVSAAKAIAQTGLTTTGVAINTAIDAVVEVTSGTSDENKAANTANLKAAALGAIVSPTVSVTLSKGDATSPMLRIKNDNSDVKGDTTFELSLTNAEWGLKGYDRNAVESILAAAIKAESDNVTSVEVLMSTATTAVVKLTGVTTAATEFISIPMFAKTTATGEATVTINPINSGVSAGTYTFAIVAGGATTTTIEKTVALSEANATIKPISVVETVPGTLEAGAKTFTLKLSNRFEWVGGTGATNGKVVLAYGDYNNAAFTAAGTTGITGVVGTSTSDLIFTLPAATTSTQVSKLVFDNLNVKAKSTAKDGDVAEITISGAGMTKQTIEVSTFYDYGYTLTVEDKALPVLYSGSGNVDDNNTLKVIFKEVVEDSWVAQRKTTFTLPEGVKFNTVEVKKADYITGYTASTLPYSISKNELTLSSLAIDDGQKATIEMIFNVNVSPEFTGDVTVTVGGSAVGKDNSVVAATVEMPFTVEADLNEVNIDYRNVEVSDITIKEAYAGALAQGKTLTIAADSMSFERGATWEVVEGDIEIKDVKVNTNGRIEFTVKSESAKTPGVIKFSNIQLYLNRALPAGDYGLFAALGTTRANDAFFYSYGTTDQLFDVAELEVLPAYVKVITAGRDQDDSTFTTKIVVPIGALEIKAGEKAIAIDTAAFINADGYTMMPLRGVVEALSSTAIVSWDNDTRTATILFGSRVISMTIENKEMVINGTKVAMSAAPVIENSRTFLPLRDMGYALGLGDDKISWDDTAKVATLN